MKSRERDKGGRHVSFDASEEKGEMEEDLIDKKNREKDQIYSIITPSTTRKKERNRGDLINKKEIKMET